MARRVFFTFHYEDVRTFRANVVRKHGLTKEAGEAGFFDASIWEDAKRHGDAAVKSLVNSSLENTSVTCALIGTETWRRRWVRYEILRSYDRGNQLFGIHINSVPDKNQRTFPRGRNPFAFLGFGVSEDGKKLTYYEHDGTDWRLYQDLPSRAVNFNSEHWGKGFNLSAWVPCYDWMGGEGYDNFSTWVESAK